MNANTKLLNFVNFLKSNFLLVMFLTLLIIYLQYRNILSWGGYAGYVLQAKVALSKDLYSFIDNQRLLYSYTEFQRDPVYTPIGLPILINLLSIFHNWNLILIKLIIPISLFLLFLLIIKRENIQDYKFLMFIPFINPAVIDEFRDIQSEIPGVLFFFLGIYTRNSIFKNLFFIVSILFRPTFTPLVLLFFILQKNRLKKKIRNLSVFTILFSSFTLIIYLTFDILISGDQSNTKSGKSGIMQMVDFFISIDYDRFNFIFSELGRLFVGFTTNLNFLIGLAIFGSSLFFRNYFGYAAALFVLIHFGWEAPYFVRYFLPVLFFYFIGLFKFLKNKHKFKSKLVSILILFFISGYFLQIVYQVDKLQSQRGPYQTESIELFKEVEQYSKDTLFSFHSPRVFRLFTNKDAYRYDTEFIPGTVVICEYINEECYFPKNYELVFSNNSYKIFNLK